MTEKLKAFICDFLCIDAAVLTDKTDFRTDLNLDSLTLIGLVVAIENEFDIEIHEEDMKELTTIGELIAYADKFYSNK